LAVGLVMALPLLASTMSDAATPSEGPRAKLRAELRVVLNDYLAARGKPEGISGVSAFVSRRDGDPGVAAAAGSTMRDGRGVPVTPEALFEIGSNTKAFTAAVILQLEAAGRLDIDQTVGDWLPQYPAWGKVSIRRLLNMTSGIPTYSEAPRFMHAQGADMDRHYTPQQLVRYAYPRPGNELPPSTGWFYSNTNYILAGMIAAKAGGASYDLLLRRQIFRPLGLEDTFYTSGIVPRRIIERMASGYFENPTCSLYRPECTVAPLAPLVGKDVRKADLTWTGAAGGIISTPRDLALWVRGLFGGRVMPRKQLNEMLQLVSMETGEPIEHVTPQDPSGFSLGLGQIFQPGLGRLWFFEGVTLGYRAVFAYFPKDDLVMTAATNSQPAKDQIGNLMSRMYQTVQK